MSMKRISCLAIALLFASSALFSCTPQSVSPQEKEARQLLSEAPEGVLRISANGYTDYRVVVGADASETVRHAAEELCAYLGEITGAAFGLVEDSEDKGAREFWIGETNRETPNTDGLGEEGFVRRVADGCISLCGGGERGTLYAVYSFLEEVCGVRYYTVDFETVPHKRVFDIKVFEENRQTPGFSMRTTSHVPDGRFSWNEKQKLNDFKRVDAGGGVLYTGPWFVHTLGVLSGREKHENNYQPCLTDEGVYQTVLANVRKYVEESPDASIISVSQNDGEGECACERCLAEKAKYGNTSSGLLLQFVNRIADDIKGDYPDIFVDTLAYGYTQAPPENIVPRDNVIIRLCSIYCCLSHPYAEQKDNEKILVEQRGFRFVQDIEKWADIAKNLYIWDYNANFSDYLSPLPNMNVFRQNIAFLASYGADGYFMQGQGFDYYSVEFGELRAYLVAKLLWNPNMSETEFNTHLLDFLYGFYGMESGETILGYIRYTHNITQSLHYHCYASPLTTFPFQVIRGEDRTWLWDETHLEQMQAYWQTALDAAEDETAFARVEKSSLQVLAYEVQMRFLMRMQGVEVADETLVALNRRLYEKMLQYGVKRLSEVLPLQSDKEPDFSRMPSSWYKTTA